MIEEKKRAAIELRNKKRKEQGMSYLARFGLAVADPSDSIGMPGYSPVKRGQYREDVRLCKEQLAVMAAVRARRNVFFTGSAGCGKSFTLQEICRYLQSQGRSYQVTAPSGIAAINVGGTTLHSFAHLGLGKSGWLGYIRQLDKQAKQRWLDLDVLIIDEISMLGVDLFVKVDQIAQHARRNSRPFGGLQIILCGDFCQLPPVSVEKNCWKCGGRKLVPCNPPPNSSRPPPLYDDAEWVRCNAAHCRYAMNRDALYVFESYPWRQLNLVQVMLKQVFRQEDKEFVDCLNRIRFGKLLDEDIALLKSCERPLDAIPIDSASQTLAAKQGGGLADIIPTNLHPKRIDVSATNNSAFAKLEGPKLMYKAVDRIHADPVYSHYEIRSSLDKGQAPRELSLAIGAQVMLIKNLDFAGRLVNGSRGVVVDFVDGEECISDLLQNSQKDSEKSVDELQAFQNHNGKSQMRLPIVMFCTGATRIIQPVTWEVPISHRVTASRLQIPLIHAWAMTIHKCQGMTLDRANIRIDKVFSTGQAYVALSRCRTLEGLQIAELRPEVIRADPKVVAFYEEANARSNEIVADLQADQNAASFAECRSAPLWEKTLVKGIEQYLDEYSAEMVPGEEDLEKRIFLETMDDLFQTAQNRRRRPVDRTDSGMPSLDVASPGRYNTSPRAGPGRLALIPQERQLEPIVLSDESDEGIS
jgi:ATP-dependent DNA helicase PIF1